MIETVTDALSPKVIAVLAFPALLIVSLPFSFIAGVLGIIATDSVAVGWGVGIVVALLFAFWASYGSYKLSLEAEQEAGAEAVSA